MEVDEVDNALRRGVKTYPARVTDITPSSQSNSDFSGSFLNRVLHF